MRVKPLQGEKEQDEESTEDRRGRDKERRGRIPTAHFTQPIPELRASHPFSSLFIPPCLPTLLLFLSLPLFLHPCLSSAPPSSLLPLCEIPSLFSCLLLRNSLFLFCFVTYIILLVFLPSLFSSFLPSSFSSHSSFPSSDSFSFAFSLLSFFSPLPSLNDTFSSLSSFTFPPSSLSTFYNPYSILSFYFPSLIPFIILSLSTSLLYFPSLPPSLPPNHSSRFSWLPFLPLILLPSSSFSFPPSLPY